MLARRIIAVSPDRAFGDRLAIALEDVVEKVDVYRTLDILTKGEVQAAMCVIHVDGELAAAARALLPRLGGDFRVVAVVPQLQLASLVEVMHASERIAAVTVAENFDPAALVELATRIITHDAFGLEKVVAPGTAIQVARVGDYQQKSSCVSQISAFVEQQRAPRGYAESIEQCLDEMLMNALYDAPIDDDGVHVFSEVTARTRLASQTEPVTVQYACDGNSIAIGVRDAFGSLARDVVLRILHKCLYSEHKVDRRAGGAGVGLYLMLSSASSVYFSVIPKVATEVVCTFDLRAGKLALARFGFFLESVDVTGKLAPDPGRKVPVVAQRPVEASPVTRPTAPGGHRALILGGAAVGAVALGVGAYLVVGRASTPAPVAAPVAAPAVATIELDTTPTGAAVELDGKPLGATPIAITSLAPGASASLVLKRPGYQPATVQVTAPARGATTRRLEQLAPSDDVVRVHFVSTPPGAQVIQEGVKSFAPINGHVPAAADRTYTPADVFVEVGKEARFTLIMPGRVPLVIEPFTPPRGARVVEKGGELVEGATLHLEAPAGGKLTVSGAAHCVALAPPADCVLAPGNYLVAYEGTGHPKITRSITMASQDLTISIAP